jgi:2'-5' RNA ligase
LTGAANLNIRTGMRLFTGIDLPEDVATNLNGVVERLRHTAHLKWTPVYNLHVTTNFIGEWPETRLQDLIDCLRPLGNRAPIFLKIEGIGWFPNPHTPRVLWAGINAGPELEQLAGDTDEALAALGVERETKKFSPHLTLARIKDAVPLAPVRQAIAQLPTVHFGEFMANGFHLYSSTPGPSGSIYTHLAGVPFLSE